MLPLDACIFTPAEMLAVTGIPERLLQVWIQRGFFARAARPGAGVRRRYSLFDMLYLGYLRVAADAHVPLSEATVFGLFMFPALQQLAPAEVIDSIQCHGQTSQERLFAVFSDSASPTLVTEAQMRGVGWWATRIDIGRIICETAQAAKSILERRSAAA